MNDFVAFLIAIAIAFIPFLLMCLTSQEYDHNGNVDTTDYSFLRKKGKK